MPYSLAIFWHERQRFLPAVLAVAFSALLIALQCGLLLGIFSITSLPVDSTSADLWLGSPGILSVDQGTPIPATYLASLARQPEVEHCEIYLKGLASWVKPDAPVRNCAWSSAPDSPATPSVPSAKSTWRRVTC